MYLCIDIGGTKTRVGVAETLDKIDDYSIISTSQDFSSAVNEITNEVENLLKEKKPTDIIIGVKGPLSPDKQALLSPPDLPDWAGRNLKNAFEEKLKAEVIFENDAALGGLGEAVFGPGKGKRIVVYLTISTGVGGSRYVDGKIDSNSIGFEPGHQIIDITGDNLCGCGGKGHLEAFIGGACIGKIKGMRPEEIEDVAFWDDVSKKLAVGVNNVCVLWSPDIVILGGSLMSKISIESVRNYTKDAMTLFKDVPEIVPAELGDLNGLYGGLAYLKT